MKLKFLFLFFLCAYFFNALGQVNTTYFFLGNVYSVREHGLENGTPTYLFTSRLKKSLMRLSPWG